jgi:hypothetical protein
LIFEKDDSSWWHESYPVKDVPNESKEHRAGALKILKSYHPGKHTMHRWRLPAAITLPYYLQF